MKYFTPNTPDDAIELTVEHPDAKFIAGGTDLSLLILDGLIEPGALVDISGIELLKRIDSSDSGVSIGAAVTMKTIAEAESLPACLSFGAASVGSPQIRNMATLGGNICNASPCGDSLPGLLVLGARLHLKGPSGERIIPPENFFNGPKSTVMSPGELLVSIEVPDESRDGYSGFSKIGKRRGQVISQVNAAVWFRVDEETGVIYEIRIAAGSVAPVPMRLKDLENELRGNKIDAAMKDYIRKAAGNMVSPITDVRASEWYRRGIMGTLIVQALESAVGGSGI